MGARGAAAMAVDSLMAITVGMRCDTVLEVPPVRGVLWDNLDPWAMPPALTR